MKILDRGVIITRHAFLQARKRGIYPDMIEATIKGGKQRKFGKNLIKFSKRYKKGVVICVGEIVGDIVKIKTIEWRK